MPETTTIYMSDYDDAASLRRPTAPLRRPTAPLRRPTKLPEDATMAIYAPETTTIYVPSEDAFTFSFSPYVLETSD
jgi:hypothetical protein